MRRPEAKGTSAKGLMQTIDATFALAREALAGDGHRRLSPARRGRVFRMGCRFRTERRPAAAGLRLRLQRHVSAASSIIPCIEQMKEDTSMSTSTTDAGARAPRIPRPWHGWRRTARLGVAVLVCTFASAGQAQDECSNLNTAVNRFAPLLVLYGNLRNKEVLVHVRNFFEMGSERSLPLSKFLARRFIPAFKLHGAKPVGGTADENGVITLRGEWDVESEPGKLFLFLEVKQLKGGSRETLASEVCWIPVESIGKAHLEPDLESHGRFVVRKLENDLPGDERYRLHIKPFTISGQALSEEFSGYLHDSWLPAFTESNRFTIAGSAGQSDGELHGTIRVLGRDGKVVKVSLRILGEQGQTVAATNVELAKGLVEEFFVLVDPVDPKDKVVSGGTSAGGSSGGGEVSGVRLEQCAGHVEAGRSAEAVKCYADVLKETPGDTQALAGLAGTKFRDCAECPELVVVASGSYEMGSERGESDEKPVHEVRIGYPLAVGMYEVTFGEWDACVEGGGCGGYRPDDEGWGRGPQPVINVSWDDAQGYVGWLSGETGEEYRLLSESEWEYVARAGTRTAYWWGDEIGRNRANCNGCGSRWDRKQTAQTGSFPENVNAFGLYDVHGNVGEWVEDCYSDGYARAPVDGSAWEWNCDRRVLRGGSWINIPRVLRSAFRNWYSTGVRVNYFGFRVARTLTP